MRKFWQRKPAVEPVVEPALPPALDVVWCPGCDQGYSLDVPKGRAVTVVCKVCRTHFDL